MDDEELDQDVFLRLGDSFENAVDRRIAVHQELDLVTAQDGNLRKVFAGSGGGHFVRPSGTQIEGIHAGQLGDVPDLVIALLSRCDIALELASPKNPVGRHRHVGKGVEGHGPGHGPLCGSGLHDGEDR